MCIITFFLFNALIHLLKCLQAPITFISSFFIYSMTAETHSTNTLQVISRHGVADVWFNTATHHHSLHAANAFSSGDIIVPFKAATIQSYPTYLTVQTGDDTHITLSPDYLQYVNHSCEPNAFFDTTAMQLVCTRDIKPGDEICFFYPSTEWEMDRPFNCHCRTTHCLKIIKGAASLDKETLGRYRLADFIVQKLNLPPNPISITSTHI